MIEARHLREADLILCMEAGHVEALQVEFPDQAHKVHLITDLIGRPYGINDPYGGPMRGYELMYETLVDVIDTALGRIIALAEANAAGRMERVRR
jgi:protein-tyrosine-phosphatase